MDEGLLREAVFAEHPEARLCAIGKLSGDLESLLLVAIRSRHRDSAEAARKAYFEALDHQEEAIVNRCVAISDADPGRRERAVGALRGHPEELSAVAAGSKHPDTRAMALAMLLSPDGQARR